MDFLFERLARVLEELSDPVPLRALFLDDFSLVVQESEEIGVTFLEHFFQSLDVLGGLMNAVEDFAFGHDEFRLVEGVLIELDFPESKVVNVVQEIELGNDGRISV